jgi:hypothetical protein
MNPQYSPRTESMIATAPYLDSMRVAAMQQEAPLFDRFSIMRQWHESGEFDLFGAGQGLTLARSVHNCVGRTLADLILNAAKLTPPEPGAQR